MMSFKRNERRLSLTILVIFALSLLAFPVFSLGTPAVQDDMPALSQLEGDVYVSIDGDDEEGTGSAENPYRTIQKGALMRRMPKELCVFLPGITRNR